MTNMKTKRYPDGQELFFARSMILHAARTAGIAAIDTVYSDVENMAGFQAETALIKQLGFDGKSGSILAKSLSYTKSMHQLKQISNMQKKLFGQLKRQIPEVLALFL